MNPFAMRVALALAVAASVWGAERAGWFAASELGVYDRWVATHAGEDEAPVTLLRVTEAEIARHGHPLEDALLADVLTRVVAAEPRAVGVDIYRDRAVGEGAEHLEALARRDSRIIWVHKLPDVRGPGISAPRFAPRSQHGFSDVALDEDGVARRGLLYLWDEGDVAHVSFALQLALRFLQADGLAVGPASEGSGHIVLGETVLRPFESRDGGYGEADAGGYQFLLDYRRGHQGFTRHSVGDLLAGRVPAEAIEGRVVIVGTAAPSVKDLLATPLGVMSADPHVPGMELHAHAVDQLVRTARGDATPLRGLASALEAFHIALWALAGVALGTSVRHSAVLVAAGLALPLALVGCATAAYAAGWWVPVVAPSSAFLAAGGLAVAWTLSRERSEKAELAALFGRHVSPAVFEAIWQERDSFMHGGRLLPQRLTATVLMVDLAGFSEAADALTPDALMDWLGTCTETLADVVHRHGGIVEDYAGDGMKANFGVPVARETPQEVASDARAAVSCALAMEDELERLNEELCRRELPPARIRVGIETGPVVVGSLGGREHLKYTTVGDAVVVAARLESLDRDGFAHDPGEPMLRILVGPGCAKETRDVFPLHWVGRPVLKGKHEPSEVHRVGRRETRDAP